ncbi:MAG: hypothetical protein AB7Q17_02150 [Phycisphaerae bacterium]
MSRGEWLNRRVWWLPPSVERELAALEAPELRMRVRRRVYYRLLTDWRYILANVLGILLIAVVVPFLIVTVARYWRMMVGPGSGGLIGGVVGGVLGGTVGFGGVWLFRRRLQRSVRGFLNEHGVPVCEPCGYRLEGHTSARCPECGADTPARVSGSAADTRESASAMGAPPPRQPTRSQRGE